KTPGAKATLYPHPPSNLAVPPANRSSALQPPIPATPPPFCRDCSSPLSRASGAPRAPMGSPGMATAAGTAVLVYLVLSGRLCRDADGAAGGRGAMEDEMITSAVSEAAA
uniref:Uncharacterized protein n=1 Tax=Aegilops tauschii subsp. strangulata TaxID=200361 RepID=A0A453JZQ6_AEGTS